MAEEPAPINGQAVAPRSVWLRQVRIDQAERWRRGERVPVEAYREREPALVADAEAILDLVYSEVLLREEQGEHPTLEEYLARFPQHEGSLRRQFELHQALAAPSLLGAFVNQETLAPLPAAIPGDAELSTLTPDRAAPALVAPVALPGYHILGELGRGGMGVVYKARQVRLNRLVAVKMVLAGAHVRPEDLARFLAEAKAVAALQHPNIVQIFEVGQHAGLPFLVLEYLEGGSLSQKLQGTPLPAAEAAQLVETLARAMHAAHERGIIHRDLKPANVLLDKDGRPKVTDFGLAKYVAGPEDKSGEPSLTHSGAILGTPSYMAPEQAEGKGKAISPAADVYALGAILYELLTGRPPFKAATPLDTVFQVLHDEPVSLHRVRSGIPRDLETICQKCLEKEPAKRYASAEALAEDLRHFRSGEPIQARPVGVVRRTAKWARRRPAVAALVGLCAVVVVGFQLGVWWHLHRLGQSNAELAVALAREKRQSERASAGEAQAQREQQRAEEQTELARRNAYVTQIRFAAHASASGQPWRAVEALNRLRPRPGKTDERGLEWFELWRRCRREALYLVGHSHVIHAVAFTPDSRTLASASADSMIKLWDTTTGQVRVTLLGHPGGVVSLAISPDGRTLASAGGDAQVRLWDIATGQERAQLAGHQKECIAVAFSPDGRWLASGGKGDIARLWDLAGGREHWRLALANEGRALAFSPDSRRLAVADGKTVKLCDVATGRQETTLNRSPQVILSMAFSPDGRTLAAGAYDDGSIRLWDLATAQLRQTLRGHTDTVYAVAFAPDGRVLASGSYDRTLRLWDVATGRERRQWPQRDAVETVAFSPDGRLLAHGGGEPYAVALHDLGEPAPAPPAPALFPLKAWAVAFAPGGRTLASGSQQLRVTLWDPATGQVRTLLPLLFQDVYTVAYSPDGRTLAAGTAAGTVVLYDVVSGSVRATLKAHHARVKAVAFSPDGSILASASWDKTVKLWDPNTGQLRATLAGHLDDVNSLAFAPDGRTLASAGHNDGVRLWSSATGQCERILQDPSQDLGLAFSPDGRTLAAGSDHGFIRLWDLQTGRTQAVLPGHPGGVKAVTFSPDGRTLASAGVDKTIKLWDVTTELELVTLTGHKGEVNAVAFSPDGKVLASASHDGTVKFWRAAEFPSPP